MSGSPWEIAVFPLRCGKEHHPLGSRAAQAEDPGMRGAAFGGIA